MADVTIVGGCPGSGKSTLSRLLAAQAPMGVCIETDVFYRFLAHRIDPSTPESNTQNTAVVRAFLQAAVSFSADGYEVTVEGVIGPWWLPAIREVLPGFRYVILHADLTTVLERTAARAQVSQASANPALVRTMHAQFDALSDMNRRTIQTTDRTVHQVLEDYERLLAEGRLEV